MCRVERVLRTLCLELSRLCLKYHHQRIRDHQNGTDAGLGFWVIGLPDFFCIFVRFCCEQACKSNRFRTYPALRVLPGGNQVDGLPPAFSESICVKFGREKPLEHPNSFRIILPICMSMHGTSHLQKNGAGGKPSTWFPPGTFVEHMHNSISQTMRHF